MVKFAAKVHAMSVMIVDTLAITLVKTILVIALRCSWSWRGGQVNIEYGNVDEMFDDDRMLTWVGMTTSIDDWVKAMIITILTMGVGYTMIVIVAMVTRMKQKVETSVSGDANNDYVDDAGADVLM
jgi:hypothetical protein